MLKTTLLELIIRGIPETAIFVWVCCVLSKTKIKPRRYIVSCMVFICISYIVRNLPINMGINTMLTIGALILINIKINKISVLKSIQVSFIAFILEFICEAINMIMIKYLFKADLTQVFSNTYLKTLYGIPSLVLFVFFTFIINVLLNKKAKRSSSNDYVI